MIASVTAVVGVAGGTRTIVETDIVAVLGIVAARAKVLNTTTVATAAIADTPCGLDAVVGDIVISIVNVATVRRPSPHKHLALVISDIVKQHHLLYVEIIIGVASIRTAMGVVYRLRKMLLFDGKR